MNRIHQIVLVASTLVLSWFAMMVVHETGHILGVWITGGTLCRVVLHPLTISRTDVAVNPQPLIVAWAGPLFGAVAPLAGWIVAQSLHLPGWYILRFFAGFCLIANGAYLGFGSFDRVGDAGDLVYHGASLWQLWLFGALCLPMGFLLWHRLGPHFGLGDSPDQVNKRDAYGCLLILIVTVTLMALFGGE